MTERQLTAETLRKPPTRMTTRKTTVNRIRLITTRSPNRPAIAKRATSRRRRANRRPETNRRNSARTVHFPTSPLNSQTSTPICRRSSRQSSNRSRKRLPRISIGDHSCPTTRASASPRAGRRSRRASSTSHATRSSKLTRWSPTSCNGSQRASRTNANVLRRNGRWQRRLDRRPPRRPDPLPVLLRPPALCLAGDLRKGRPEANPVTTTEPPASAVRFSPDRQTRGPSPSSSAAQSCQKRFLTRRRRRRRRRLFRAGPS